MGTRDISGRAVLVILESFDLWKGEAGAAQSAMQGFRVPVHQLSDPKRWLDWDTFVDFMSHLDSAVGSLENWEHMGAWVSDAQTFIFPQAIMSLLMDARFVYWASSRWIAPALFPAVPGGYTDLEDGRILYTATTPSSLRSCPQILRHIGGSLPRAPEKLLGQKPAHVQASYSERHAEFVITLPASLTLMSRIRERLQRHSWIRSIFEEGIYQDELKSGGLVLGEFKTVSVDEIIEKVFTDRVVEFEKNEIRFRKGNVPKGLNLECQFEDILRLLNRLLTSAGGIAKNQTEVSARWVEVSAMERDDYLCLIVLSGAVHYPDEVRKNIFESFFGAATEGRDQLFELSEVNRIVKHHRGRLSLDADNGMIRFKIMIPKQSDARKAD